MGFVVRALRTVFIFLVSMSVLWFIDTQIFKRLDEQLPFFVALVLTYVIAAYILLPQAIHLGVIVFRRGRIPRVTRAPDGLPAHPVNVILLGSETALRNAFLDAGWHIADPMTPLSAWNMIICFLLNRPYPQAPFSRLYLFGRKQDIGFQMPIGQSPRKRHHVRFWAVNTDTFIDPLDPHYWLGKQPVDHSRPVMWVGSGNEDVGLGFTKLTFQITHKVDAEVDQERDFIIASLQQAGHLSERHTVESGECSIGKYASDGRILVATLKD